MTDKQIKDLAHDQGICTPHGDDSPETFAFLKGYKAALQSVEGDARPVWVKGNISEKEDYYNFFKNKIVRDIESGIVTNAPYEGHYVNDLRFSFKNHIGSIVIKACNVEWLDEANKIK